MLFALTPDEELFPSFPVLLEATLNFIFNFDPEEYSFLLKSEAVFLVLVGEDPDNVLFTLGVVMLLAIEEDVDFDELEEKLDFIVIGFPPWLWWEGKLRDFTLDAETFGERIVLPDIEALTMDKDDECLVEELVDKADMDKVLLVSILVFLF